MNNTLWPLSGFIRELFDIQIDDLTFIFNYESKKSTNMFLKRAFEDSGTH